MSERELLINTLEKEKKVRQALKNHPQNSVPSQPLTFFGSKYNQILADLAREGYAKINLIDFSKIGTTEKANGHWVEKEIEWICLNHKNEGEFSLLCFLNLNEISGTALEKALLPFFDSHQNTHHQDLDLSPFILVATSSTSQLRELSPPLISRLKCVNQDEVKLPKTFVDRHFSLILTGSILLALTLLLLVFYWKNRRRTQK